MIRQTDVTITIDTFTPTQTDTTFKFQREEKAFAGSLPRQGDNECSQIAGKQLGKCIYHPDYISNSNLCHRKLKHFGSAQLDLWNGIISIQRFIPNWIHLNHILKVEILASQF